MSKKKKDKPKIEITSEYRKGLHSIFVKKFPFSFLYGVAGCGKSTFLKVLEDKAKQKKVAYIKLAPTGIAALNIGGQTIHSFFKFNFNNDDVRYHPLVAEALGGVDLIIIDEVSMVRADLMDRIDKTLQKNKRNEIPFGGVQILVIGDLYQLPPVVINNDLPIGYDSPYFFSAHVFKHVWMRRVELTKIFRQDDIKFKNFLNNVREAKVSRGLIEQVNKRIVIDHEYEKSFNGTFLCTINAAADRMNSQRLKSIDSEEHEFFATTEGNFPEKIKPVPSTLKLKVGAKVVMCKNEGAFVNGQTGIVHSINGRTIKVKLDNGYITRVEVASWNNIEYLTGADKKVVGTYYQFPLKLGWAITIHKCQGMTITDKVVIDSGGRGFWTAGQFYVAMSRVTSPKNVKLRNNLTLKDIIVSDDVVQFFKQEEE